MVTYENTKTVADFLKQVEESYSDRIYIRYEENDDVKDVTFGEFVASCKSVAAWVDEKSEKNGQKARVGVIAGSSHQFLAVLFGVMMNGNVVVPLDVQLNVEGLAESIDDADLDYLFYDWDHYEIVEAVKEKCPALKETVCMQSRKHVYSIQKILKEERTYEIKDDIDPFECAMILFTSGTTGKGKGVMLSQDNLIDNIFGVSDDGEHPEDEVYLNVLPVHHVYCISGDFFIGLRYGNMVCLNQDMSKLGAHMQLFQPTTINMVPMMAKTLYNKILMLINQYPDKDPKEIATWVFGKRLYRIICGGGYLAPELAKAYWDLGIDMAQGYGMSECAPTISEPVWERRDKVASVGQIVKRCEIRIVDGEIQVKSRSVMMGYYKNPEETAKTITEDGWLRTGDLGYIDEEGFVFFTGRCKNLIILSNGENVAPEQLENLFVDESLVEEILVFGEDDKICAEVYPNLQAAESAGIEDIEQAIFDIVQKHNQELPTYKRILQTYIRYIPFEKNSSRKIVRGKFFEQKEKRKQAALNYRKPENETQQVIFNSVSESLGHQDFGIDTDLYEAGLDSLGSVLLLSSLYDKLQISITLQELSQNSTVEKLELFAREKKVSNVDYSVRKIYPLTGLQQYFAYILRGHTTSNLPFLYKLDNSVDIEKLKWATEQVFEVHPELKDVIQLHEGAFVNVRDDERKIDIPIIKMSDEEWNTKKNELITLFMYTENEPLYHAAIYQTDSANYLFFDLAHIIGDGMSINILFEDINNIYVGKEVQKQSYTMYEYVLDYWDRKSNGATERDQEYFMKLTDNLKIRKSILNKKDSYDLEHGINKILKGKLGVNKKKIKAFCHKYGVSENVLFLAAFNYCISVFADDDDVVSTTIHSGRTDSRWNRLIGPLFTTYYYRFTRKPHETVPEFLKKSAKQIMNTMDCQLSNMHADEMFFQYQGDILDIGEIGGAPAEYQEMDLDALPFHMQLLAEKKGYVYLVRYWENRYDKDQLELFLRCYEAVIEAMLVESSVRRIKKYIPECERPKHFFIEAGKVNEEAGFELIPNVSVDTKIKAYVLDSSCLKKPFGAWGDLYIMDYPTKDYVDQMDNPYGDGTLYQTGYKARITIAGNVEFLDSTGRIVMIEGLRGRDFIDLYKVEQALYGYEGITSAEAYTYYGDDNNMHVGADVTGVTEEDVEKIKAYMSDKVNQAWIPAKIVCK
ncbi:MAG: AMP-binding protein [Lachnospiraceae bacterium]|nr:AMP-binding protein [Lachnospiraceae bacterium]